MNVHLASAVSFNRNVCHSLTLNLFYVFCWFSSPSLSLFSGHQCCQVVVFPLASWICIL